MATIQFVVSLAGTVMLLLYAVRLVQTGLDRAYGGKLRQLLRRARSPGPAAALGVGLAIVLQSSAAVVLLTSEFVAIGTLPLAVGLAIAIGADLGSAIVVKLLSFRVDWLIPILLTVGGGLFLRTTSRKTRQTGRILIGVGLILLSLKLLRETTEPLSGGDFLPMIANYLEGDPLTGFLVGAVLAFVMHSSVAVILMCVAFLGVGTFPFAVGLSLVLGANLGSGLIPLWLTRRREPVVRRVPLSNFVLRGAAALVALWASFTPIFDHLVAARQSPFVLVLVHVLFNASLLLALPAVALIARGVSKALPDPPPTTARDSSALEQSALDTSAITSPSQAIACLRREILRMAQIDYAMMLPASDLLDAGDPEKIVAIQNRNKVLGRALTSVRQYTIRLNEQDLDQSQRRDVLDLTEYAINLEAAGDIVAKRLLALAAKKHKQGFEFSVEGWNDFCDLHTQVIANTELAMNLIVTPDVGLARRLVAEKADFSELERLCREKHLRLVQANRGLSLEGSNLHLDALRALKDFNSELASVAYPILEREGQLLSSRLVQG